MGQGCRLRRQSGRIRFVDNHTSVDYLIIGHVSRDLTPSGYVAGGTAVFSARVAQALGCRTAVLTSTALDYDLDEILPGISIHRIPSKQSTIFENTYSPAGRKQTIHSVAETLTAADVPAEWRRAAIVHLGPIANEIDPGVIELFSNSLVGLTPQGWYRRWNREGQVLAREWPEAAEVLPLAAVVILSMEDIPGPATFDQIRQLAPLVVLTQQSSGCTVYFRGESRQIQALPVTEVNPTGAGDTFATAFLVRLHQTKGNPWEAAEFANRIASCSVAYDSLAKKLEAITNLLRTEG